MVSNKVKLMLGFTVVFLLSSILFANSLNFVDAAPPPDKEKTDKKKYPYTDVEWECIGDVWWIVIYEYTSPKEKHWLMKLKYGETCSPGDEPPKRGGVVMLIEDGEKDATYTSPALNNKNTNVLNHTDFSVTALPIVVAPVEMVFKINTLVKNNLKESMQVELIPIIPDKVVLVDKTVDPFSLRAGETITIFHVWKCFNEEVSGEYGFTFLGYPTSKLGVKGFDPRVNVMPLKVTNTVTCLNSTTNATGTVQFETPSGTGILVFPESGQTTEPPSEEKKPKGKGPKGVEQQGVLTPSGNYLPPIKQMKMGITPHEVLCNEGMELIFKSTDGSPVCVSMVAAEKLVERGWATR